MLFPLSNRWRHAAPISVYRYFALSRNCDFKLRYTITRSSVIFTTPFNASMTLFREKRRLMPCFGLILLNLGRNNSPLTRNFVCASVTATAQKPVTSMIGSTVFARIQDACCSISRRSSVPPVGLSQADRQ